jgi:hypothetical protein
MVEISPAEKIRLTKELDEKFKKIVEIAGDEFSAKIQLAIWTDYCLQCLEDMKSPVAVTEIQKACSEHQEIASQLMCSLSERLQMAAKENNSETGGSTH